MNKLSITILCVVLFLAACSKEESTPADQQRTQQDVSSQTMPSQPPKPVEPVAVDESLAKAELAATEAAEDESPINVKSVTAPTKTLSDEGGIALAKASGCLTCHSVNNKIVGPAWADVAKHYKGDDAASVMLMEKIKTGGKGNWAEITGGAAMPPYSPRVSDVNIEKLVDFILSLQ